MLQPLSLLTFNLDLLFQHHHLEPDSNSPEIPSPGCQDAGSQLSPRGLLSKPTDSRHNEIHPSVDLRSPEHQTVKEKSPLCANPINGVPGESPHGSTAPIKPSVTIIQTSPQLLWVQEKEIEELPPPVIEEDSLAQQAGQVAHSCSSVQFVIVYRCVMLLTSFFKISFIGDPAGMGGCDALGRPTQPELG